MSAEPIEPSEARSTVPHEPTLRVESLWKRYGRSHAAIRRRGLSSLWGELRGTPAQSPQLRDQEFWALQDVNFEARPGHSLGVMGLNGAGKSTLLRVLAGLSKPDRGQVVVRGTLTALLDPNGGFDELLTGRENVLASPLIHRVPSSRRDQVLERIMAFADIGDFIDAPLRTYSKGMRMRLAFATAVNSHADTILIDEVVAVGDIAFQRKCFNHLQEFVQEGGTLVIVAHSTWALDALCDEGLLLSDGAVLASGPIEEVTGRYSEILADPERSGRLSPHDQVQVKAQAGDPQLGPNGSPVTVDDRSPGLSSSDELVSESSLIAPKHDGRPVGFRVLELLGPDGGSIRSGGTVHVRMVCDSTESFEQVDLGVLLATGDGQVTAASAITTGGIRQVPAGISTLEFDLHDLPLVAGRWAARFALIEATTQVVLGMHGIDTPAVPFDVEGTPPSPFDTGGRRIAPLLRTPSCSWSVVPDPEPSSTPGRSDHAQGASDAVG